ncbi:MAG TPA: hypothetical protein VKE40_06225 [Gemmataceae bacterium]|nr:hypothetical protein [Gemmataceae bacterium]
MRTDRLTPEQARRVGDALAFTPGYLRRPAERRSQTAPDARAATALFVPQNATSATLNPALIRYLPQGSPLRLNNEFTGRRPPRD